MSLKWGMDKQTILYPYNELLLSDKRNELLIHVTTWLNLKYIILSERGQTQKSTYHLISFYDSVAKTKLQIRRRKKISGCQGLEEVIGLDCKGAQRNFLG